MAYPTLTSPEDEELQRKRVELEELESRLSQAEMEHATATASLRDFELRYLRAIGSRYAKLDALRARVATAAAQVRSGDQDAESQAATAREAAAASAAAAAVGEAGNGTSPFLPSDELKQLYRQFARRAHPDLADDESERLARTAAMTEANCLYGTGDLEGLRRAFDAWLHRPEAVPGDTIGADLVRAIRQMARVTERLCVLEAELATLMTSAFYQLMETVTTGLATGRDVLKELAAELDAQIDLLQVDAGMRPENSKPTSLRDG